MAENPSPHRPLVEVCAGSLRDALVAGAAGADRIELCSATELGGLTPSIGLVEQVLECISLPIMVMIRPRTGGFCYDRDEFNTAMRDAEWALSVGAQGIAFGFLTSDGNIDVARCRELLKLAGQRQTVFHRAFDFVRDAVATADQLVELGFTRLLTSGQQLTAVRGAQLIRSIVERTSGSLEIMPGGGVNSENLSDLLRQTGCTQVHVGAAMRGCDGSRVSQELLNLSTPEFLEPGAFRMVDGKLVSEIVGRLEAFKASQSTCSPNDAKRE